MVTDDAPDVKRSLVKDSAASAPLLRRLNASAVLRHLIGAGEVTGTELIGATQLSRPTVHAACADLIAGGWVVEVAGRRPDGDGRPGRPARCYRFNAGAGHVIGVDLGEWKVSLRLTDLNGDPLAETVVEFSGHRAPAAERIRATRRGIRHVLRESGVAEQSVLAVCVGVAAAVRPDGGIYPSHPDYLPGLADLNLAEAVGRGYAWPVVVENDANVAVLAERWQGAAVGAGDVVLVLAGERMGAGILVDGQLLRGAGGAAGELAFLELVQDVGDTHGIGAVMRMSGQAAVERANHARRSRVIPDETLVGLAGGDPERVSGELVERAASHGDPTAQAILDQVATRMARVVGVLAGLLDPEVVVIGGGATTAVDLVREAIVERLPPFLKRPPRIETSTLGPKGVLVGTVRRALDHAEETIYQSL